MKGTKRLEVEIAKVQSEIRDRRQLGQPTSQCFKTLRRLKKELRTAPKKQDQENT